jgi:hypothetical protein
MGIFILFDATCFLAGAGPLVIFLVARRRLNTFWGLWCIIAFVLFWLLLIPVIYA